MALGWLLGLALTMALPAVAQDIAPPTRSYVAVIIDDLGDSLRDGERVVRLPGPVACAILPHTAFSMQLAVAAHDSGKEVLLHLPMEALNGDEPGPGALDATMPALELALTLRYDLETVPHAVGINNHMGSRLTQNPSAMGDLMREIRAMDGLFFVDSMTTPASIAARVAAEHGIPALSRHVFLDNDRDPVSIAVQLKTLARLAHRQGGAIAIGHAYPETLTALERWIPTLGMQNIELVPLSVMIAWRRHAGPLWQARWSASRGDPEGRR